MKKVTGFLIGLCLMVGSVFAGDESGRVIWQGSSKDPQAFVASLFTAGAVEGTDMVVSKAADGLYNQVRPQGLLTSVGEDRTEFIKAFGEAFGNRAKVPLVEVIQLAQAGRVVIPARVIKTAGATPAVVPAPAPAVAQAPVATPVKESAVVAQALLATPTPVVAVPVPAIAQAVAAPAPGTVTLSAKLADEWMAATDGNSSRIASLSGLVASLNGQIDQLKKSNSSPANAALVRDLQKQVSELKVGKGNFATKDQLQKLEATIAGLGTAGSEFETRTIRGIRELLEQEAARSQAAQAAIDLKLGSFAAKQLAMEQKVDGLVATTVGSKWSPWAIGSVVVVLLAVWFVTYRSRKTAKKVKENEAIKLTSDLNLAASEAAAAKESATRAHVSKVAVDNAVVQAATLAQQADGFATEALKAQAATLAAAATAKSLVKAATEANRTVDAKIAAAVGPIQQQVAGLDGRLKNLEARRQLVLPFDWSDKVARLSAGDPDYFFEVSAKEVPEHVWQVRLHWLRYDVSKGTNYFMVIGIKDQRNEVADQNLIRVMSDALCDKNGQVRYNRPALKVQGSDDCPDTQPVPLAA